MRITRRRSLTAFAGSLVSSLLFRPAIVRAQTGRELVVITYPGQLSEPHRSLADQIEARHSGLRIRLVPSDSQDVVAQIKAGQGYSPYDVMPNDEPPHLIGIGEGYLVRRDDTSLPNLGGLYPELLAKSGGFGVPATYSLIGIAYNTQLVRTPPRSWADLWRPEYRGKVGIARTSSNLGLATLVQAAKTFGGSETDLEPGWAKLREIEPRAARSPAAMTQMLEREEIALAPLWNNNSAIAAGKGLPIAFAKPDPGAIAILSFFSAVTGTREPALANEWLNGIIGADYQARAAASPYFFGPTVRGITVPEDARAYTPASPAEIAALQTIDWRQIVPIRGQLVERFDRTFSI